MMRLVISGCVTLKELEDPTAVFGIFGDKRQLIVVVEADLDIQLCGASIRVITVATQCT